MGNMNPQLTPGDKYRDIDGDTWTVDDDGKLALDRTAFDEEPLARTFDQVDSEFGPLGLVLGTLNVKTALTPVDKYRDGAGNLWTVGDDGLLRLGNLVELEYSSIEIGDGPDMVNQPPHYQTETGLEAIEVIDAFFANDYHLGTVFKYLARAGKKDNKVQDLSKAAWYLQRAIDLAEDLP